MDELEQWLEKVYASGGDQETLEHLYDEWAKDYDQQLWASGNPYIAVSAGMAGRHIPAYDAVILDAGCGTGNMAQVLHQIGFENLEGLEPSAGMLAVAERKGIYKALHQLALGAQVDLPPESYDAVVASGVLTHGHAPPESIDGILKLVRPQGVVIFSLSEIAYEDHGFKEKMAEHEENNNWAKLDRSRLFRTYPFSDKEAHLRHWVYVYRKVGVGPSQPIEPQACSDP